MITKKDFSVWCEQAKNPSSTAQLAYDFNLVTRTASHYLLIRAKSNEEKDANNDYRLNFTLYGIYLYHFHMLGLGLLHLNCRSISVEVLVVQSSKYLQKLAF